MASEKKQYIVELPDKTVKLLEEFSKLADCTISEAIESWIDVCFYKLPQEQFNDFCKQIRQDVLAK